MFVFCIKISVAVAIFICHKWSLLTIVLRINRYCCRFVFGTRAHAIFAAQQITKCHTIRSTDSLCVTRCAKERQCTENCMQFRRFLSLLHTQTHTRCTVSCLRSITASVCDKGNKFSCQPKFFTHRRHIFERSTKKKHTAKKIISQKLIGLLSFNLICSFVRSFVCSLFSFAFFLPNTTFIARCFKNTWRGHSIAHRKWNTMESDNEQSRIHFSMETTTTAQARQCDRNSNNPKTFSLVLPWTGPALLLLLLLSMNQQKIVVIRFDF